MSIKITSTDSAEHIQSLMEEPAKKVDDAAPDPKEELDDEGKSTSGSESDEGDGDDNQPDPKDVKGGKSDKGDKRIDKLTKGKSDAERERDYWKQLALEGKKPTDQKQPDKKPETKLKEPNPDDYEEPNLYYKALAKYEAEQAKDDIRKELKAEAAADKEREKTNKQLSSWQEKMAEARTRYTDFDEVTDTDLPITAVIQETFMTSDVGADLAYWWGNNPEEAKKLVKLEPVKLARELGKIEAKVEAEVEALKEKAGKSSKTENKSDKSKPAPISPLKGGGKGNIITELKDDMPYPEWKALRNKQLRDRKRA